MGPRSSAQFLRPLLTLLGVAVLAACTSEPTPVPTPSVPASQSTEPTLSAGDYADMLGTSPYPATITDDSGRQLTFTEPASRIVSLAPSNTEMVCALDACDRLVGVTDFDDYPAEVADVPDVVVAAQVDVERVRAAEPDLVLAAGNGFTPPAIIEQLIDLGIPVMTLNADSLEGVYADIRLVALAFGFERLVMAEVLIGRMQDDADAVVDAVADAERPLTFYEVSYFEGTIYTAGEDSFLASLIEMAGGDPITGDPQSFAIDLEALVAADPELILLGDASYDPSITPESVAERPGWGDMTAVREGRVVAVEDDVIITRPGPRIVEGLEALARAIHPELFE